MVTQVELKEALHYSLETGVFIWIKRMANCVHIGDTAGSVTIEGYRQIRFNKETHLAHRLAWLYVHGDWPKEQIDHINHIKTDNRILNLREVTRQENQKNRSFPKDNTSGVVGVYWHKRRNKWQAAIRVSTKLVYLGYFVDKYEAICARKSANNKYGFHENHGVS